MQNEWKSEMLSWKAFFLLVIIAAIFGTVFLLVFSAALIADEGERAVVTDSILIDILVFFGLSFVFSVAFFFKDWFQYKSLSVQTGSDAITFESGHYPKKTFSYKELLSFKRVKTIYGFKNINKIIMHFKSADDKRRHRMIILLREDNAKRFMKALEEKKGVRK